MSSRSYVISSKHETVRLKHFLFWLEYFQRFITTTPKLNQIYQYIHCITPKRGTR